MDEGYYCGEKELTKLISAEIKNISVISFLDFFITETNMLL